MPVVQRDRATRRRSRSVGRSRRRVDPAHYLTDVTVRAKTSPSSNAGSFAPQQTARSRVEIDYAETAAAQMVGERRRMFSNPACPITHDEAQHVVAMEVAGWSAARSYWRMRRYAASHDEALTDAPVVAADPMSIEWYGSVRASGGKHADAIGKVRSVHTHTYATVRESRPMADGGSDEVWVVTCKCGHREEQRLQARFAGD